ncbi:MAG TPA: hypothetical protein VF989_06140 [Polyangiaceae bacterium]
MLHAHASIRTIVDKVPPHARDTLRRRWARAKDVASAACLWEWQVARFELDGFDVLYLGRAEERWRALLLFLEDGEPALSGSLALANTGRPTVTVTDALAPNAFRVPSELTSLVHLGESPETVAARLDGELRRRIRRLSEQNYRLLELSDPSGIARLNETMFVPFTMARHPKHGRPHSLEELTRFRDFGNVFVLMKGDEEVGAQVGYSYERHGTRRWMTERFGYPERIFSNKKRLAETNAINIQLACDYAGQTRHDHYDLGASPASPNGGLLRFKRRRRAVLEPTPLAIDFHVTIPGPQRAQVLGRAPLFSLHGDRITLNVGVRECESDSTLLSRFEEWGYGGIERVLLWTERDVAPGVLAELREHYRSRGFATGVSLADVRPPARF